MNGVIMLTRPSNWQGVRTLHEFARRGIAVSAVVVEPKTLTERSRRFWKFLKVNGPADTLRKVWRILMGLRYFSHEMAQAYADGLPRNVPEMAARLHMPVHVVESHNGARCENLLRRFSPDLILLVGTRIIEPHVIRLARVGCLNAHSGWLPDYRGVHANLWALLEGGRRGVTVHYVDSGVDTGPILLREGLPIGAGDTLEAIEVRTVELSARLMGDAVVAIQAGRAIPVPQRLEEGRQFRAIPFRKEEEVRRLLKNLVEAGRLERMEHGGS